MTGNDAACTSRIANLQILPEMTLHVLSGLQAQKMNGNDAACTSRIANFVNDWK